MLPKNQPVQSCVPEFDARPGEASRGHFAFKDSRIMLRPDGNIGESCPCIVSGLQRGEINVRTNRRLNPATQLVVSLDGIEVPGVVSFCTQERDGYFVCIATGQARDRRRTSGYRQPAETSCSLIVPEDPGDGWVKASIADYSWFGLGVKSALQFNVGMTICVKTDSMLVAGIVRHYRRCKDGLVHTGIDVTDILQAAEPGTRGGESFIDQVRRSVAELILGRSVDRHSGEARTVPWALPAAFPEKTQK